MTNQPLVSCLAICYNHERFVTQCLDSIHAQTYPHTELIIVDDCSSDSSRLLIKQWIQRNRPDSYFIAHETNRGLCRSLNDGLRQATGKYVSLIATDDVWLPEKLQVQVTAMEQEDESVGVLYSDAYHMDEVGHPLPGTVIEDHLHQLPPPEGQIHQALWERNWIPALTTLIRRRCYEEVGYYDENSFTEDWDMWLRMARSFRFVFSPFVSAKYRIVSTSISRSAQDRVQHANDRVRLKHFEAGLSPSGQGRLLYGSAIRLAKHAMADNPKEAKRLAKIAIRNLVRFEALAILACLNFRLPHAASMAILNSYTTLRMRVRPDRNRGDRKS